MANIKSQIKRNRQNERRRMRNKVARSELKTRIKRAVEGVDAGADDTVDRVRAGQKRLATHQAAVTAETWRVARVQLACIGLSGWTPR